MKSLRGKGFAIDQKPAVFQRKREREKSSEGHVACLPSVQIARSQYTISLALHPHLTLQTHASILVHVISIPSTGLRDLESSRVTGISMKEGARIELHFGDFYIATSLDYLTYWIGDV